MNAADIPDTLYNIAKIIYEARIKAAWDKQRIFKTPAQANYYHNPVADFDLALAGAKELLRMYTLQPIQL
jgi:hypothetical protein